MVFGSVCRFILSRKEESNKSSRHIKAKCWRLAAAVAIIVNRGEWYVAYSKVTEYALVDMREEQRDCKYFIIIALVLVCKPFHRIEAWKSPWNVTQTHYFQMNYDFYEWYCANPALLWSISFAKWDISNSVVSLKYVYSLRKDSNLLLPFCFTLIILVIIN